MISISHSDPLNRKILESGNLCDKMACMRKDLFQLVGALIRIYRNKNRAKTSANCICTV